ncbi:MAG: OmpH family outer membrane protein [Saprospiraceae bacterium]|nr:OmpH family outer membrane protein [Saprospiraceae bacterium]|tara:strand:- start:802 stop:1311 length:510 start_codon:yes stop_codon:yes gene_type:complete
MKRNYIIGCLAFLLIASIDLSAQKFGYINSQLLISQIPQVKEANANIETLQKQLEKQGQEMVASLQNKYQSLEKKQSQGEISRVQLEAEAQGLKQEEATIAKFQQDSQQKIYEKSESLLKPIRDKIQTAIDDVAKENDFQYVFDQAVGILLYADTSTDITPMVRTKLGL